MQEAKRIIVTGATGLIGRALCRDLIAHGYTVVVFSRDPQAARVAGPGAERYVPWRIADAGSWAEYLDGAYGVVHLAGGSIFTWGKRQTRESVSAETQSRIRAIGGLVNAMAAAQTRPQVFVAASSVGIYGFDGLSDTEYTESSAPGADFWGQTSLRWEEAAQASEAIDVRAVCMRFGYVLGMEPHSGLAQQVEQFCRGYGGRVGSGKQWQPWIHVADAAGLIRFALEESLVENGLNATAPEPLRNRDFTRALAAAVGKSARMMTPGFLLRMWLGVTADTILYGRCVPPRKALDLGYAFQFATLEAALRDLLQAPDSAKPLSS